MTIIQRYLTREIIKQIFFVLVTVVFIYVVVDFFEKADNFMKSGLPFSRTLTYFTLNIPFIISQIAPVGILLAVIIIFYLMNKNNEVVKAWYEEKKKSTYIRIDPAYRNCGETAQQTSQK